MLRHFDDPNLANVKIFDVKSVLDAQNVCKMLLENNLELIAVDLEGFIHEPLQIFSIQMAFPNLNTIVYWDLEHKKDIQPFMHFVSKILKTPSIKILHQGKSDFFALQKTKVELKPVLDTSVVYEEWKIRYLRAKQLCLFCPFELKHCEFSNNCGLNDLYKSCGMPLNSLKKKSISATAKIRYACMDVLFLGQCYLHMRSEMTKLDFLILQCKTWAKVHTVEVDSLSQIKEQDQDLMEFIQDLIQNTNMTIKELSDEIMGWAPLNIRSHFSNSNGIRTLIKKYPEYLGLSENPEKSSKHVLLLKNIPKKPKPNRLKEIQDRINQMNLN